MKKLIIAAAIVALAGCATTQNTTSTQTTSTNNITQNTLDWAGVYQGVFPCADCEGINTSLTLNYDGTFMLDQAYKKGKVTYMPQPVIGTFSWNKTSPLIYLKSKDGQNIFFVGEGYLKAYDQEGNPIESNLNYTLKQVKVFEPATENK